jgi:hypothetical protein
MFTRFRGSMRYDPSTIDVGDVMRRRAAESLAVPNQPISALILETRMMNAAWLLQLTFCRRCQGCGEGRGIAGGVTMQGQTRSLTANGTCVGGTATGGPRREGWGITGGQRIGASTIRSNVMLLNLLFARSR